MDRPRNAIKLFLVLLILLVSGCSRYVTSIVTYGTQLTVEVKLQATADPTKYRYFMVISTQEVFNFPILPPEGNSLDEFLEPGNSPRTGSSESYYANYYATWHSYIVFDNLGYYLVKGPFISGLTNTREAIGMPAALSDKLTFTVPLERIFGATVPDTIYFDLITVDYPSDNLKYLKDHAAPPTPRISKISGSILPQSDEAKSDIDPALDIRSWTVKVE